MMSDTRSRRATNTKRKAVGGRERGGSPPWLFIGAIVAVVFAFVVLITVAADSFGGDDPPADPIVEPTATPTSEAPATAPPGETPSATKAPATAAPTPGDDGKIEVACNDILAPVDKDHRLPRNCAPNDLRAVAGNQLRAEAATAFEELRAAALQEKGYDLYINSGYRSYQEQVSTYDFWVRTQGQAQADRSSARPGHSEHQLGTTADVGFGGCELECTIGTPQAAWLAENAHEYGFIVSYPDGKEQITGYMPEPWHIRYVGKDVARQVKDSGLTLHEFLLR
jgi:zinc D-Ala-D-Ala carboxypeptidase